MVCCNIDDSELPDEKKIVKYMKKSLIIERSGRKIGIVGFLTPETAVSRVSLLQCTLDVI